MQKYLIILILVIIAYYLHRYCIQFEIEKILKTKEGFADTVNTSDPDLIKSITTLGQIAKDLQGSDGLKVPGNLIIKDRNILNELDVLNKYSLSKSIHKKHNIAGYLQLRDTGTKVPFYYGLNIMWRAFEMMEVLRHQLKLPVYKTNWAGVDARFYQSSFTTPHYLTVLPGYKARLYYWKKEDGTIDSKNYRPANQPSFTEGEYYNTDTKTNAIDHKGRTVHFIIVTLADEIEPDESILIKDPVDFKFGDTPFELKFD